MEKEKVVEHPPKPHGADGEPMFDSRVKIVNEKTGKILAYQPYVMHTFGEANVVIYERPPGSGNMFNAQGESIGRYEFKKDSGGTWSKFSDDHIATKPHPIDEKEALRERLETTEAELAALKAERDDKSQKNSKPAKA